MKVASELNSLKKNYIWARTVNFTSSSWEYSGWQMRTSKRWLRVICWVRVKAEWGCLLSWLQIMPQLSLWLPPVALALTAPSSVNIPNTYENQCREWAWEHSQNRTEHGVTSITIFLQKMGLLPKRWIFYANVGIQHVLKHDNSCDPFTKSTILLQ
jgi:hypothetical protein